MAATMPTQTSLDPRAIAYIDSDAIEHNCSVLKSRLGQAELCAVVKADGYGHGAATAARAALLGGASWLAVVTAAEATSLRAQGIVTRLLVMGALTANTMSEALAADADVVVWREDQITTAAELARTTGSAARLHVKLDSGMGRLGAREPDFVLELANRAAADQNVELAGLMTHFATADEPDSPFFDEQLERFTALAERIKREHPQCAVHAANSAAVFRDQAAHFDLARCGIAIYGLDPFQGDPQKLGLRPALALEAFVADVKTVKAGETVGYGRTWAAERDTDVAVLPIGYGDGYRRALSNKGEVLIGGRRYPVIGTVSMDNVTVDLGVESGVERDARAVLIGADGNERILAEELATRSDTINYEVTCDISQRVPRVGRGSGEA